MSTRTWEPGVPLYPHPSEREYGDGNYVRHLFDIVGDEEHAIAIMVDGIPYEAVCANCLVGWPASEGPDCWNCTKRACNYDDAHARELILRRECRDVAILTGGPGDGLRHHLSVDEMFCYVDVRKSDGRPYTVYPDMAGPDGSSVRHRYLRTDEWDNRRSGYRFRHDGPIG